MLPSAVAGGSFEKWYFKTNPSPKKLVWQITTPNAEAAVKAVPLLLKNGGIGIDINMGCSAPQIVNTGAGIAWMTKPKLETANLVQQVKMAILNYQQNQLIKTKLNKHIRLSVKLRLGETDDYSNLLSFCKMLVEEGVELITLHPRTRKQKYSRPCKHEYTARLASDLKIPIYANGDINSTEKLERLSSMYKCDGWMIGRVAVQKPWIFAELKTIQTDKKLHQIKIDMSDVIHNFFLFLKEEQPTEFYLTRAQRFFAYFCDNFKFAHHIKTKILNCKNIEEMQEHFNEYFLQVPEDKMHAYTCKSIL